MRCQSGEASLSVSLHNPPCYTGMATKSSMLASEVCPEPPSVQPAWASTVHSAALAPMAPRPGRLTLARV